MGVDSTNDINEYNSLLEKEIRMLINSGREDDYWDFKQCHHKNMANLLHDIICMANNRADRDAYIIFGVTDKTFEVMGVESDINRRNQQQIIDILKSKKFSSGIRPRIEVRTLYIRKHEIDVLTVKNATDTPYFLIEDYRDQDRVVRAHYIYTRVGDTNTDIDKSSDINHVEYLWKKRFLLNRPPLEQITKRLENKNEWICQGYTYYNTYNPEYTIELIEDEKWLEPEFYSYAMYNNSSSYGLLEVKCYGTKLYGNQTVTLDSGRYITVTPNWEFLSFGEYKADVDYAFKYFVKQEIDYKLHLFLLDDEDEEDLIAHRRLLEVILIFDSIMEKEQFIEYIYTHQRQLQDYIDAIDTTYSWIEPKNELKHKVIVERLKTGIALNRMLKDFRLL